MLGQEPRRKGLRGREVEGGFVERHVALVLVTIQWYRSMWHSEPLTPYKPSKTNFVVQNGFPRRLSEVVCAFLTTDLSPFFLRIIKKSLHKQKRDCNFSRVKELISPSVHGGKRMSGFSWNTGDTFVRRDFDKELFKRLIIPGGS